MTKNDTQHNEEKNVKGLRNFKRRQTQRDVQAVTDSRSVQTDAAEDKIQVSSFPSRRLSKRIRTIAKWSSNLQKRK